MANDFDTADVSQAHGGRYPIGRKVILEYNGDRGKPVTLLDLRPGWIIFREDTGAEVAVPSEICGCCVLLKILPLEVPDDPYK